MKSYLAHVEQIVIIMASEDGAGRVFIKNKADYLSHLEEALKHFYKYYKKKIKIKSKTNNNLTILSFIERNSNEKITLLGGSNTMVLTQA